jgi:glucose/galactose transporter
MQKETSSKKNSYIMSITIIGVLFFILGFITWLNGMLIPYLKTACELTNFQALFVTFAFYISYTVMALPGSWLMKKVGFKNGMSMALFVMAAGALIFIPAAYSRTYFFFLTGLFILGTGMSLLQTAVNPYITILGPIESAAKRISIMGIANKVAGAIAPLALAYFIVHEGDDALFKSIETMTASAKQAELDLIAHRVIIPYIGMAVILVISGLGLLFAHLPDVNTEDDESDENNANGISNEEQHKTIFSFPYLVFGVLTLFFYVGAEVIAGDTIIRYGQSLGIPLSEAKAFTTFTMIGMLAGYVIGIFLIPKYITQKTALKFSALLGVLFSLAAIYTEGYTSVLFIAALGIANALVWPAVWPLAIHGLGKFINTGSALLVMAISGGALLPLLWGKLSDIYNSQEAYWVLIPLYAFIYFFAVKGHKIKSWKNI